MNALDRMIGALSPAAGLRRAQARDALRVLAHYRAGDLAQRSGSVRAVQGDADAVAQYARRGLSLVARDVIRNNPTAARALQVIENNVVGTGIEPRLICDDEGVQREWRDHIAPRLDTVEIDQNGVSTMGALQAMVLGAVITDGDALVIWPVSQSRGLPVRVLESDYLDTRMQGPIGLAGNSVYDGVEYDPSGRVVAYHIFDEHPGSAVMGMQWKGAQSTRTDAARVVHLYRADRPGQRRGVTWFAPVLDDLVALAENDEAQLMRQKIAACFAAFWRSDTPGTGDIPATLAPGLIQKIGRDDEVQFANPPDVTGYDDFSRIHLRRIAAGMGITYEALTGDLTGVNFSSARLGRIEMGQNVERWQYHLMMPRFCAPVGTWILRQWIYDDGSAALMHALTRARIAWTPPPPVIADPKTEIEVAARKIETGLSSRHGEIRKLGYAPEPIDAEIDADMTRRRDLAALKQPGATPQIGDMGEPDGDAERDDGNDPDSAPARAASSMDLNSYGVAVRSGFVTPQIEDEVAIRASIGLPEMSASARALWDAQGRGRQPVTLKSGAEGKNDADNARAVSADGTMEGDGDV